MESYDKVENEMIEPVVFVFQEYQLVRIRKISHCSEWNYYRILLIKFWEPASDAGLQTSRPWRKKGA